MAYTPPTFDASGQTWAQLLTLGFSGFVKNYVAALSSQVPTFDANQAVGELLATNQAHRQIERARNVVDNYMNMTAAQKTANKTTIKTEIFDLQLAFGSISTALGEIGVLVEAN